MRVVLLAVVLPTLSACATIIHGTRQRVSFASTPPGATVRVGNDSTVHTTPVTLKLKRKTSHHVRIELDGYLPYDLTIKREISSWVAGNLVLGGVIGVAIDAVSGGMYVLAPNDVSAGLVTCPGDEWTLLVVLRPEPGWTKVAQLQPRAASNTQRRER